MGVNATRDGMARDVSTATNGARLIGFNDDGEACVWYGGHALSIYDVARGWEEIRYVTSGQLMAVSDKTAPEGFEYAKERMRSEGFEPVA